MLNRLLIVCSFMLCVFNTAHAQSFAIELLVIQWLQPENTGENWSVQQHRPRLDTAEFFLESATMPTSPIWSLENLKATGLDTEKNRKVWQILRQDQLELTEYIEKCNKDQKTVQPLLHVGWTQNVYAPKETTPWKFDIPIQTQATSLALNGTFSVHLHSSNYLFVNADWVYRRGNTIFSPVQTPNTTPLFAHNTQQPLEIPFKTKKRVRSGEVHYFDHPLGAMLVMIRKV